MDKSKISVHPLVVMSISDHYTRALYRQGASVKVIGVVLGQQNGLNLDVANLIEICLKPDGNIDETFARERIAAYKKMYPDLEVVGWYTASKDANDEPSKDDLAMQANQITKFCENPLLFVFNVRSQTASDNKSLPLFCYEKRGGALLA